MLKSLYDFESCYPKTISFEEGEFFLQHQTEKIAKQRNWWQVVSIRGNIGFVPSNYVMKIKVQLYPFYPSTLQDYNKNIYSTDAIK